MLKLIDSLKFWSLKDWTKLIRKLITILIGLAIVIIAFTQRAWFIHAMKHGGSLVFVLSILFVAVCVFVPGIPFVVTSGVIGNIYGIWEGLTITLIGSLLATMVMFYMARFGFSDWARRLIETYPKAKDYEAQFEQQNFLTILIARLIPLIPSTLINVLAGLSKMSWVSFFLACLLAKLPVDLIYTIAGKELSTNKWVSFLLYGSYIVIVILLTFVYRQIRGKKTNLKA